MGWRDLITSKEQTIVAPWVGSRSLRFKHQTRSIRGTLPQEYGWYEFSLGSQVASFKEKVASTTEILENVQEGFLVGNRFVPDAVKATDLQKNRFRSFGQVFLLDECIDRFSRIQVGTSYEHGPLIFKGLAYPLGPEEEVLSAFLDRQVSIAHIKEVIPSLQTAFEQECQARYQTEKRCREIEQARRRKEHQLAREKRRKDFQLTLESSIMRRELAASDFPRAAKAALAVGGAELLDVRNGRRGEKIIRYRIDQRRFECICDLTFRIIDAGVCLTSEQTGEKGDTFFTLESLPAVIRQAEREGVLVIYRHI